MIYWIFYELATQQQVCSCCYAAFFENYVTVDNAVKIPADVAVAATFTCGNLITVATGLIVNQRNAVGGATIYKVMTSSLGAVSCFS